MPTDLIPEHASVHRQRVDGAWFMLLFARAGPDMQRCPELRAVDTDASVHANVTPAGALPPFRCMLGEGLGRSPWLGYVTFAGTTYHFFAPPDCTT